MIHLALWIASVLFLAWVGLVVIAIIVTVIGACFE